MKLKVGSKIYVPQTEAQGEVTKVEAIDNDFLVWVKWENFPISYSYSYQNSRHCWDISDPTECKHRFKKYIGFNSITLYCQDCPHSEPFDPRAPRS